MAACQGFRKKMKISVDHYIMYRIRDKKDKLLEGIDTPEEKVHTIIDLLYSYSTSKNKGVSGHYKRRKEEWDELLTIYEEDIKQGAPFMDSIHTTRLGLMLAYMFTKKFTNLYWRVEARSLDLID